ncbi:GntR family transcriptional regulator [Aliihoeflea sp. 2WW]|uniref:GntR family transcriptional regulator n=1 Tax=Aliihoeflea sp. 2WW TaxID=1381123 RepID=UPI00046501DC|nr:GntR family transcriptional regulator [Aliihoeflea sp. 2WW]
MTDYALSEHKRDPGRWEALFKELQREIIFGTLRPRERLVEDEIIARLDATRHAVRRAFAELERVGLVIRMPNRGVQVRDYTLVEVEELYEIREILEARAARRMSLPAPKRLLEELGSIAEAHARASREERYLDIFLLNNEFHEKLYGHCGNGLLAEAIKSYTFASHPIRSRGFPDAELRRLAVEEHRQILDALAGGDADALAKLCVAHIQRPKDYYLRANRMLAQSATP